MVLCKLTFFLEILHICCIFYKENIDLLITRNKGKTESVDWSYALYKKGMPAHTTLPSNYGSLVSQIIRGTNTLS
jgi:hypothetical protein